MSSAGTDPTELIGPTMPSGQRPARAAWVCLMLVLAATAALRTGLLDIPLERDEGEYAYVGQRMLAGEAPYAGAYTLKWPGTHAAYAASMALFGESLRGVRLGFMLVNLATIALLFALARRLAGPWGGVAAALTYAALSTHSGLLGQAGHATHYVVLCTVAALALTPRDPHRDGEAGPGRHLLAGALLGCAVLMKQTGIFFALFGVVVPLLQPSSDSAPGPRRKVLAAVAWRVLGALLPIAATCGWLAAEGVFDTFWFWTVTYAREYATTTVSLSSAAANLRMAAATVLAPTWPLWALGGLGLLCVSALPGRPGNRVWLVGLLLASVLALLPGLQFRRHYFVLLLPVVALLAGTGLSSLARLLPERLGAALATALLIAATGFSVWGDRAFLWLDSPFATSRALYGTNPFPEAELIAAELADRAQAGDELVVFGSEPELPFLAGLRSATGFLYVYGLMEEHPFASQMQRDMIAEVEAAAPTFAVFVETPSSWLQRPESDEHVLDWMRSWLDANYTWIGAVEVLSPTDTRSYWDEQTLEYRPRSPNYCLVFRRRNDR